MAQFKGVRKLSVKQYNKLKSNGLLDKNILYVTPEKGLSVLQGETAPTTETEGVVGQFYLDTTEKKLYQCVSVTETTYEWQEVGGGSGVSQEDFDNLVNNETQIKGSNNSFMAGNASSVGVNSVAIGNGADIHSSYSSCVAIGNGASAKNNHAIAIGGNASASSTGSISIGRNATSLGSFITAIGYNANGGNYASNVALGYGAFIGNNVKPCIQIGDGSNNTDYSLQIFTDNIYNYNTHTLTVQKIEQNGNKVYGVITGFAGTPTYNTVGAVGQIIINQTLDAYICVGYDSVEYTWKKITI